MGLESLQQVLSWYGRIFGVPLKGLDTILVGVGFTILLLFAVGFAVYLGVAFIKRLTTLPTSKLLLVMLIAGIVMILVGLAIPA